jgi:hypothetical protein
MRTCFQGAHEKLRTFERVDGLGHRFRPARKPCLALTKITSRSGLDASERI